nr:unnamed protein product [Callosobruchus chinensis]
MHCNVTFSRSDTLDDHIVKKHPDFIASVSRKIHTCTQCKYKTVSHHDITRHMLKHSKTSDKGLTCVHCEATFKRGENLDDHIVKKHPDFIASISRKVHQCSQCTFKSVRKGDIDRHVLRHHKTSGGNKLHTCKHCKASFSKKQTLDDHIVRKHPEFIESVTNKIHQCTQCAYKTIRKDALEEHMLSHPETAENYVLNACICCNATFKRKRDLDAHIVKKHPDSVAAKSRKVR